MLRTRWWHAAFIPLLACGTPPTPQAPLPATVTTPSGRGVAFSESPLAQRDEDALVPIDRFDPSLGDRSSATTVLAFVDLAGEESTGILAIAHAVEKEVPSARVVWKTLPAKDDAAAHLVSTTAQAVFNLGGHSAFFKFVDGFVKERNSKDDELIALATAASGASKEALVAERASARVVDKLARDRKVADGLKIATSPELLVNGVNIRTDVSPTEVAGYVKDQAETTKKSGVTDMKLLYAELVTAGRERVEKDGDKKGGQEEEPPYNETLVWNVPVGTSPVLGSKDALVTIVDFADFECPYCAKVEPTFAEIRKIYGDKVRFVWKHEPLPFHPKAIPAAMLALEARAQRGDAGFWKAHDAMLGDQEHLDKDSLLGIAEELGLDLEKVDRAIETSKYKAEVDRDLELAQAVEASGTPHLFINGRRFVGAQPFEKLKPVIDEEIVHAEALVKKGVKKNKIYEHILATAVAEALPVYVEAKVPNSAPRKGSGKVVVQEFADFQCPFCVRVKPTISLLMHRHNADIQLVWRNLPLPMHPDAPRAAEAAFEAKKQKGDVAFWKMYDLMFRGMKKDDGLSVASLSTYAKEAGLDVSAFNTALESRAHKALVEADKTEADRLGFNGAPSFLIGGYMLSGAQSYRTFEHILNYAKKHPKPAKDVVRIVDVSVGSGKEIKSGDEITVHYTGTLMNGTVFDTSKKKGGAPFELKLGAGSVIKGWDQGLVGMKPGGKRILQIPPALGYADKQAGSIPAWSTLVFEVELLSVK